MKPISLVPKMKNSNALKSWPLVHVEMNALVWYANQNDSIDVVGAAVNDLSVVRKNLNWVNKDPFEGKFDPAKKLTSARIIAVYLTFAAWERSERILLRAVKDVFRARNKLRKNWHALEFRNRGPKTELEKIDLVITTFVKDTGLWRYKLHPWVFEESLTDKLKDFYSTAPEAQYNTRAYNRSEPTPLGGPICPAWMMPEIYDSTNNHR